ncbi:hypothetical protein B0H66DRAFT_534042 [Apodospora peruviana]|uniref:Uncharacterized protein n=1 Tax=Apodospora peruviana TaxID=516989 RepID=A0AAE0HZK1_9PEZI|nr:hypothetical protein B0H66DRAFT_534042 [Apodospora peruviana]
MGSSATQSDTPKPVGWHRWAAPQLPGPHPQPPATAGSTTGSDVNTTPGAQSTAKLASPTRPLFKMKRTGFVGQLRFSGGHTGPSTGPGPNPGPKAPGPTTNGASNAGAVSLSRPSTDPQSTVKHATPLAATARYRDPSTASPAQRLPSSTVKPAVPAVPTAKDTTPRPPQRPAPLQGNVARRSSNIKTFPNPTGSTPTGPTPNGVVKRKPSVERIVSDIEMVDTKTLRSPPVVRQPTIATPSAARTKTKDFDDRVYKTFLDEDGITYATCGALLPPGYQKSKDEDFPWICPVRSCRKMLPSLIGLGKHFCNSHRAMGFNDNMDGTLTDEGAWTDPERGDGKSYGGVAKPSMILSRGERSFAESPMVEPKLHYRAQEQLNSQNRALSQPKRGGPRRRTASDLPASTDHDSGDETTSDASLEDKLKQQTPRSTAVSAPVEIAGAIKMANPNRPYDVWPDVLTEEFGLQKNAYGMLIPDSYEKDMTVAGRPWICPGGHRGSYLNDNLDGTFSVLKNLDPKPARWSAEMRAVITSRGTDDQEPIVDPRRPIYNSPTNLVWVSALAEDNFDLNSTEANPEHEAAVTQHSRQSIGASSRQTPKVGSSIEVTAPDSSSPVRPTSSSIPDKGLEWATKDRRYTDWVGKWFLDPAFASFTDNPLVPDTRGLRARPQVICKSPLDMSREIMSDGLQTETGPRKSFYDKLNDNGDGTFSIVGSHRGTEAMVVSRNPIDPNAPMAETQLPDTFKARTETERQKAIEAKEQEQRRAEQQKSQRAAAPRASIAPSSDPDGLWWYICRHVNGQIAPSQNPGIRYLLSLPKVRDFKITRKLSAGIDTKQLAGIIVQLTGEEHGKQCTTCRRNAGGPFEGCVHLSATAHASVDLHQLLGSQVRACSNCLFMKVGNQCSVKSYLPPAEKSRVYSIPIEQMRVVNDSDPMDMTNDDLFSDVGTNRRRSSRLPITNGNDSGDDGEDDGEDDGGVVNPDVSMAPRTRSERLTSIETPSEPRSKMVTIKMPESLHRRISSPSASDLQRARQRKQKGRLGELPAARVDRTATVLDSQDSISSVEVMQESEDVQMEDWERTGDGQIPAGGGGTPSDGHSGNLAFSAAHLLSPNYHGGRTIQVVGNVTFQAMSIASGTAHKFAVDSTRTRICSLASGKVRVQVDGEAEFVIGAHGMFCLAPGKGCSVMNRAYVDAVLHVTALLG